MDMIHILLKEGSGTRPGTVHYTALGLVDDVDRWWEWEEASRGRRQISWSQDLRNLAKLEPE